MIFDFMKIFFKVKVLLNMLISQTNGYFENNPWYCFLEDPMLFLLALKENL